MPRFTLTLFGPPHLDRDGEAVHLRSRKCLALLAYLTVTGRTHRRGSLASLLWPESDAQRAMNSLRNTLSLVRRALDGAWLVVDRETAALDGSQRKSVDVARFRDLLAQRLAHGHDMRQTCPECLPLLGEAVGLYQGGFMAGFTLRDAPEFDEWQAVEGEALQQELAGALERLVEGYASQGDMERAMAHAQRWVGLDPLEEGAHRALMRLYARSGRQSAALRQYESCESVLREQLGVSPGGETRDLYQAIRGGRMPQVQARPVAVAVAPARPRHNLPVQPTPFVGREDELDEIAQRLADPGCRLLTVVGPGGMGKTRLAIQTAEEHLPVFRDGVWFVPLAPLESVDLLPSAIMEALDVPRYGGGDPQVPLLNYLRDKSLLLVLDNFEHLLEGTALVTEMLRGAPGIKLLVTSRERLGLRGEWLFPLRGMGVPEEAAIIRAGEEGDVIEQAVAVLEGYSAVELFVQCARQVRPDFSPVGAGAGWVARICQLVEGMPLAIELAASWTRVMGCETIAREIEGGLDLLTTTLRDVPQRHRSMRAVFDRSWGLLSAEERSVLGRLSVFRGGCRREAAEAVADATLATLSALVDRSWLRSPSPDRYEMHELVRQYCAGMLESEIDEEGVREGDRVRDRHSRYYGAFLQEREGSLHGRGQAEALWEILAEMDNVWAAWRWAVERGHAETIGECMESFALVGDVRAWHHEMSQALEEAAAVLREQLDLASSQPGRPARERATVLLADILAKRGHFFYSLGRAEGAVKLCEESLKLLRDVEHDARRDCVRIDAKLTIGHLSVMFGDSARGKRLREEALALAEQVGDPWRRERALEVLGIDARQRGQYAEAEELLQQAIAIAEEAGEQRWKASCLDSLSQTLWLKGEYHTARALAEESLQIRQEFGDRSSISYSFERLAQIATALGDYDLAHEYCHRALAVAEEIGNPEMKGECLFVGSAMLASALGQYEEARELNMEVIRIGREIGWADGSLCGPFAELGHAILALGEVAEAREYLRRGLHGAIEGGFWSVALNALVGVASISAQHGEPERAVELLALVLHHPAADQVTRDRAQKLLTELESELTPEAFAAATARGRVRELEEVAAGILEIADGE